tara:strand:+ start:5382 stop:5849 length:468 start_codon:yes stop_codon:yes gene_type:complete
MNKQNCLFICPKCGNGAMKDIADSVQNDRVEHANELIRLIASCGREFFRHGETVAHMEIDQRGKVWFVDEYTRRRIYTHYRDDWRGFNHGGTLRNLIEDLRDYISKGETLNPLVITPKRLRDHSNIWGYEPSEAEALRQAAWKLPMFPQAEEQGE